MVGSGRERELALEAPLVLRCRLCLLGVLNAPFPLGVCHSRSYGLGLCASGRLPRADTACAGASAGFPQLPGAEASPSLVPWSTLASPPAIAECVVAVGPGSVPP